MGLSNVLPSSRPANFPATDFYGVARTLGAPGAVEGGTAYYTVTFNADGGTPAPAAQPVLIDDMVTKPAVPTKTDYVFGGWYKEAGLTTLWNFATDTVTANITIYAKWRTPSSTYTSDNISFKMVSVPADHTFPEGIYDGSISTVVNGYEIGETEVTYELWHKVRSWAETNGYAFYDNPGREGSSASSNNTTPGVNKQEPVTMVTWYDAVVWLNALTEWVNAKTGSNFEPVYYYDNTYAANKVAKNSNPSLNFTKVYQYSSAYTKPGADGFRLPEIDEWGLAARWRGSDMTNTVSGYTNPYFTKGNSASGATADYTNAAATGAVAWYADNSSGKTHTVKGKTANALGLYDMSGNVYELCSDWYPGYIGWERVVRGGGWTSTAIGTSGLQMGIADTSTPDEQAYNKGFRLARTAQ
jgi:uncharacterized repeat protein (TIGR02543 family)